ncbi:hypothetical protein [Hoeflea sp.]|uniref:hypothetical protein n=1 Tax=Hoeflea sp. TaxID=1940281 RepID=UPI003749DABA
MIRYQPIPSDKPVPPSCHASLVGRMADDMREMAFAGENVSTETLVQRGWTLPTIKRLSAKAAACARRQSVRRHT